MNSMLNLMLNYNLIKAFLTHVLQHYAEKHICLYRHSCLTFKIECYENN